MAIFPLAPDQTIAQMWSNGVRGGTGSMKYLQLIDNHRLQTLSLFTLCGKLANCLLNMTRTPANTSGSCVRHRQCNQFLGTEFTMHIYLIPPKTRTSTKLAIHRCMLNELL